MIEIDNYLSVLKGFKDKELIKVVNNTIFLIFCKVFVLQYKNFGVLSTFCIVFFELKKKYPLKYFFFWFIFNISFCY